VLASAPGCSTATRIGLDRWQAQLAAQQAPLACGLESHPPWSPCERAWSSADQGLPRIETGSSGGKLRRVVATIDQGLERICNCRDPLLGAGAATWWSAQKPSSFLPWQFAGARPALGGAQPRSSARAGARLTATGGPAGRIGQDLAEPAVIQSPGPSPGASPGLMPRRSGFQRSPASDASSSWWPNPGAAGLGLAILVGRSGAARQHGRVADRVEELVDRAKEVAKGPVRPSPSPTQAKGRSGRGLVRRRRTGVRGEHVNRVPALIGSSRRRSGWQWLPIVAGERRTAFEKKGLAAALLRVWICSGIRFCL